MKEFGTKIFFVKWIIRPPPNIALNFPFSHQFTLHRFFFPTGLPHIQYRNENYLLRFIISFVFRFLPVFCFFEIIHRIEPLVGSTVYFQLKREAVKKLSQLRNWLTNHGHSCDCGLRLGLEHVSIDMSFVQKKIHLKNIHRRFPVKTQSLAMRSRQGIWSHHSTLCQVRHVPCPTQKISAVSCPTRYSLYWPLAIWTEKFM